MPEYSFTDVNGRKVNRTDFVKVADAPKGQKEYIGTQAMVMSADHNGIIMLAVEVSPVRVSKRIFYMKKEHLVFHSTS